MLVPFVVEKSASLLVTVVMEARLIVKERVLRLSLQKIRHLAGKVNRKPLRRCSPPSLDQKWPPAKRSSLSAASLISQS
ncbi:hypothetical protein TSUD_320570 [Trifolium subterraneum]|uniref:Uncharacterized protein n=1 Tax=Trifolium subterraneum TaxID=3900 RepID=A0A2Z6NK20_TRISU|nr:hypothetical protein TSUD_320570 [Trifolium subterraneum]